MSLMQRQESVTDDLYLEAKIAIYYARLPKFGLAACACPLCFKVEGAKFGLELSLTATTETE